MTYDQCMDMIQFLNNRMRFRQPWYTWAVEITWVKVERWARRLGWRPKERG